MTSKSNGSPSNDTRVAGQGKAKRDWKAEHILTQRGECEDMVLQIIQEENKKSMFLA